MSAGHLRPAIERVIAALREALADPDFNRDRGRFNIGEKRLVVRTTAEEGARVLPATGRPVRGAAGVKVEAWSSDTPRDPNSISDILFRAFRALTDEHQYRWPEIHAAATAFADAVYNTPVLAHRVFESLGYKYYEAAALDERIAARRASKPYIAAMVAQILLQNAIERGIRSLGLEETPQLTPADVATFDRWDAVADFVERELAELRDTAEHAYVVTVFLNEPLLDHNEATVLADLRDNGGLLLRGEITLAPATDEDLAKTTYPERTPVRLPAGVESANTVLRFRLVLPVDAPVEDYRQLYPYGVEIARRVLDAIRLISEDDIGIALVHLSPAGAHIPDAPMNYAWEYQPESAAYVPRRIASAPPEEPPLSMEQIESLRRLVWLRLDDTDVKGFPIAIRRFRDSYERYEPGDPERLLDLAIALEALFLNDEVTKEQLRYRLSLRMARFLESDVDARIDLFKVARDLYDMRSAIAHGATLATLKPKDTVKLETLQREAPRITRRAITRMLEGGGPTGLESNEKLQEWWRRLELS